MSQYLAQLSDHNLTFAAVAFATTPEDTAQTLADHLVADETLPADGDWLAADLYVLSGAAGVVATESAGLFVLSREGGRGVVRVRG